MNYQSLAAQIAQYLETVEDSFVDNLPQFIKLAEDEIYRTVQLPDLRALATARTTPADRYLTSPSDYLSTYYMAVLDAGTYYPLLSKDDSFMREAFPSTTITGRPRYFSILDDAHFILGPTPDDEYTVEMEYFYKPASITALGTTGETWLSTNAEGALLYGSLIQAYIYLKGDQDVMAHYQEKYTQALADLKIIAEGRNRKDSYRTSDKRLPV